MDETRQKSAFTEFWVGRNPHCSCIMSVVIDDASRRDMVARNVGYMILNGLEVGHVVSADSAVTVDHVCGSGSEKN